MIDENLRNRFFNEILGIDTANNLLWLLAIPVIFCVILFFICLALGQCITLWGESIPHDVIIEPVVLMPDHRGIFASLRVSNKENREIANCYAVLRMASPPRFNQDITSTVIGPTPQRLSWSDNLGNENFEITIGANPGEAILYVFRGVHINAEPHLSFYTKNPSPYQIPVEIEVYDIEIDFFGKIGDEPLKVRPFVGALYSYVNTGLLGTSLSPTLYKGKASSELIRFSEEEKERQKNDKEA